VKHRIIFCARAEKDLKKLPNTIIPKVEQAIVGLAEDPRPHGALILKNYRPETWRVRVAEWRVLYRIDNDQRIVNITRVLHRREAYR